ncbi:MAG: cadherin-like domain-containing protein [Planctomycetaceae bacterium]|nr:cadherin-like domain-containing protein [Planctomycetales bacterium]MCB9875434.1 cadherin-like domain-containing protein [Planctomycetaceae bacterium]MCB9938506.1 cadherin-like domain-containing protein [Planctomycetaceae bacterium]
MLKLNRRRQRRAVRLRNQVSRHLQLQALEPRLLMTVADLVSQGFRTDTFSINTSFDYAYSEPGYQDRIDRGSLSSTNSTVTWTSPRDATGTLSGTATGTGNDQFQLGSSFFPCSTYTIFNRGVFDYTVDAVAGTYTINNTTTLEARYPTYTDHTGGNCPAPNPPISYIFGGEVVGYSGQYDPELFEFAVQYNRAGATANVPNTQINFDNTAPNQFTLTLNPFQPPVQIPAGWVQVPQTSGPSAVDYIDVENGGINFTVDVAGMPITPINGDVMTPVAKVRLFWAGGATVAKISEIPIDMGGGNLDVFWNSTQVQGRITDFATPPANATHVIVELDIDDSVNVADQQAVLLIDNFLAQNSGTFVTDEDSLLDESAGTILNAADATAGVKVLAYNPVSQAGANVVVANDRGGFTYDSRTVAAFQRLAPGESVNDHIEFLAIKYQTLVDNAVGVISINGINDPPIARDDGTFATDEDTPLQLLATDLFANDTEIDNGDRLAIVSTSTTSTQGATVSIISGNIVYDPTSSPTLQALGVTLQSGVPVPDKLVDSFTYTVGDLHGGTSTATVTVEVSGVSDRPTITTIGNQSIRVSTQTGQLPFTISDTVTPSDSLTLTVSSSMPSLLPNGNIALSGSGDNRFVQLTPVANEIGTTNVTITVTDSDGNDNSTSFTLTVSANVLPTISAITDRTIQLGESTGAINFTVGDEFTAAGNLLLTAASSNPSVIPPGSIVLGGGEATRTINVTSPGNEVGSSTITVSVTDGDGGTSSESFLVTVAGPNNAPILNDTVSPRLRPIRSDGVGNAGQRVSDLATATGDLITDVDPLAVEGIAIIGVTGNGAWEFSNNNGETFSSFGSVAETNALLLADTSVIRYLPPVEVVGGAPDMPSITFRAWDQTSTDTDTTQNGGTTAFSVATKTLTTQVVLTLGELRDNTTDNTMSDLVISDGVPGGKSDRLQLSIDTSGTQLVITDNSYLIGDFTGSDSAANSVQIPMSRITSGVVEINLGNGNNTLDIDFSNAPAQGVNLSFVIHGGPGDDQLTFVNSNALGAGGISMNDQIEDIFVLGSIITNGAPVTLNARHSIEINADIVTAGTASDGVVQIMSGHDILGSNCPVVDAGDEMVVISGRTGIANLGVQTTSSVSLTSTAGGISGCNGVIAVTANSLTVNAAASVGGALLQNGELSMVAPLAVSVHELHGSVGGLGIFLTNTRNFTVDDAVAIGAAPGGKKIVSIVPAAPITPQPEGEHSPRQNRKNSLDVNDDSFVSPLDALATINFLNAQSTGASGEANRSVPATLYLDVNGDRVITAIDALQIINYLNATRSVVPEGESKPGASDGLAAPVLSPSVATARGPIDIADVGRASNLGGRMTGLGTRPTTPNSLLIDNNRRLAVPRPQESRVSPLARFTGADLESTLDELSSDIAEQWQDHFRS